MKNVQFTTDEVNMIVSALDNQVAIQLTSPKIDFNLVGKLTAIKHKIVNAEDTIGRPRALEKFDA